MKKTLLHQLLNHRGVGKITTDKSGLRMQSAKEALPNAILVDTRLHTKSKTVGSRRKTTHATTQVHHPQQGIRAAQRHRDKDGPGIN
jgi:hypothetical protein